MNTSKIISLMLIVLLLGLSISFLGQMAEIVDGMTWWQTLKVLKRALVG